MATVTTKSVADLKDYTFFIPSYQRGYRWGKTEIETLVKDLYSIRQDEDFCLQPIIVKQRINPITQEEIDNEYELIDGQQRLVSLWIIFTLNYYANKGEGYSKPVFKLSFEGKDSLQETLSCLEIISNQKYNSEDSLLSDFANTEVSNLDSHFFRQAIKNVKEMKIQQGNRIRSFPGIMRDISDASGQIKLIWYQLQDTEHNNENPIKVFTNINAGKIRLTNAELIKAKILSSLLDEQGNPNQNKRQEIALQWEEIEKGLNEETLWWFISSGAESKYPVRIDFLFEILSKIHNDLTAYTASANDDYPIFSAIETAIDKIQNNRNKAAKAVELWKEVCKIYNSLKYWSSNYLLYHKIGLYIILNGQKNVSNTIKDLYCQYYAQTKTEFNRSLTDLIGRKLYEILVGRPENEQIKYDDLAEKIKELEYEDKTVETTLLAYNIAILLDNAIDNENCNEWFPFKIYKKQKWDKEHVIPQAQEKHEEETAKAKAIIKSYEDSYQLNDDIKTKIEEFLRKQDKTIDDFKALLLEIEKETESNIENKDNISNLVLLDSNTNRSYKNKCFWEKRKIISQILCSTKDNSNSEIKYILPGTRYVFLKSFERADGIMTWGKDDAVAYMDDILKRIKSLCGFK